MNQNELLRRLAAQAGGDAALERLSGVRSAPQTADVRSSSCPHSMPLSWNRPQSRAKR